MWYSTFFQATLSLIYNSLVGRASRSSGRRLIARRSSGRRADFCGGARAGNEGLDLHSQPQPVLVQVEVGYRPGPVKSLDGSDHLRAC